MKASEDVALSGYSTMGLGGRASYLAEVSSKDEIVKAVIWAKSYGLNCIMIGGGSNIIWKDEGFQGLVIVNQIKGYSVYDEDETNKYVTVGAGELWDSVVERSVSQGLTGIEALSLIPGSAGATPIQNVGAYGQDISQTLTTVEAFDAQENKIVVIPASECQFGYRTSRFKTTDKNRYFITAITLHLMKANPSPPFYSSLAAYLESNHITSYTPQTIREGVIYIRSNKLPDPKRIRNTGSFFSNPIVPESLLIELTDKYSSVPHWPAGQGLIKLSAAWLIEQAGLKGVHDKETGMSTWPTQPLVLVNDEATSTADLIKFRDKVIDTVKAKFGVTLEQEPELLP
ncbi:MAG TPA: UDP-N-acetylmuramate dehydrogenase [Candidatus Saccharimonadales bacterium]|nr:UDP-N-acetylmuramate dehydrogenase [Candidatus Saccharimonadales bacterium]